MKPNNNTRSSKLLLLAGAQAAAQGRIPALLNKLLPFAAAAGFVLRLFRRSESTETRPAAGKRNLQGKVSS